MSETTTQAERAAMRVQRQYPHITPDRLDPAQREFFTNLEDYGAEQAELAAFCHEVGGQFIKSASAGLKLLSLNDLHGILAFPSHIKTDHDLLFTEQLPVIKFADRFYVKGYRDRIVHLQHVRDILARQRAETVDSYQTFIDRSNAQRDAMRQHLGLPSHLNPRRETPFRSDLMLLSNDSELQARRSEAESEFPLMAIAPNQPPVSKSLSWADSELSMPPGGLGVLQNGSGLLMFSYNGPEHRLIVYVNEDGRAGRPPALLGDTVEGHLSQVTLNGQAAFQVSGIRSWEVLGPVASQSGTKMGHLRRLADTTGSALGKLGHRAQGTSDNIEAALHQLRPGLVMLLRLQDSVTLELTMSNAELCLRLHRSTDPSGKLAQLGLIQNTASVLRRGRSVPSELSGQQRIDAFSIDGTFTGPHGSRTGRSNPKLELSNADTVLLGPFLRRPHLLTDEPSALATDLGRSLLRIIYVEQAFISAEAGGVTRLANIATEASIKFAITLGMAKMVAALKVKIGRDVFIQGAVAFNAAGAGTVSSDAIAQTVLYIVLAQQFLTLAKDQAVSLLPAGALDFDNEFVKFSARVMSGTVEEYARLLVNLRIQEAAGLRRADVPEYLSLFVASFAMSIVGATRRAMPAETEWPGTHALADLARQSIYTFSRAWGAAWSGTGEAFSPPNVAEAALNRGLTRCWDQLIVPISAHLLRSHGLIGPSADVLERQVALQNRRREIMGVAKAVWRRGDLAPLKEWAGSGIMSVGLSNAFEDALTAANKLRGGSFYSNWNLLRSNIKQFTTRLQLLLTSLEALVQTLKHVVRLVNTFVQHYGTPGLVGARAAPIRVAQSIELQQLGADEAGRQTYRDRWNTVVGEQDARIDGARRFAKGELLAGAERAPTTNAWTQASASQKQFYGRQQTALRGEHGTLLNAPDQRATVPLELQVPQPVNRDFNFTLHPFEAGRRRVETQFPRDLGTFARNLQAFSLKSHLPLRSVRGVSNLRKKVALGNVHARERPELVALTNNIIKRIKLATREYTVESQFFHYPLRWPVTGDPHVVRLSETLDFVYRVMNSRQNVKGKQHSRVDPIEALMVNLGSLHAPKYPGAVVRAVVTEASYFALAPVAKDDLIRKALGRDERAALTPDERQLRLGEALEAAGAGNGKRSLSPAWRGSGPSLTDMQAPVLDAIIIDEYAQLERDMVPGEPAALRRAVLAKLIGDAPEADQDVETQLDGALRHRVMDALDTASLPPEAALARLEDELLMRVLGGAAFERATPDQRAARLALDDGAFQSERPGEMIVGGSYLTMTEIFSASASDEVTAQFLPPIGGFGATNRERSLRLDVVQETFVKIADMAELAQAEAIGPPGAVFIPLEDDTNAGRAPGDDGTDIGQVVYMRQLDTYRPMREFDRCADFMQGRHADRPANGSRVIHPYTGQFYTVVHSPADGDRLYDPIEDETYPHDDSAPRFEIGLKFISITKNYFLGRQLEHVPTQQALWLHPYTSESAKRATGDAINAVLIRAAQGFKADKIMLSYLNDATKNSHHEFFRDKGGFYDIDATTGLYRDERARDEAEHKEKVKQHAGRIVDDVFGRTAFQGVIAKNEALAELSTFKKPQNTQKMEVLAWLMVSFLGRSIELREVNDTAGRDQHSVWADGRDPREIRIRETFNNVDLMNPANAHSKAGQVPILIGYGRDGFYAIRHEAGAYLPTRVVGSAPGRTPENFLLCLLRAQQTVGLDDAYRLHGARAGAWPESHARPARLKEALSIFRSLAAYAGSDVQLLQEAMVKRRLMAAMRDGLPAAELDAFALRELGSTLGTVQRWQARAVERLTRAPQPANEQPLTQFSPTLRTMREDDSQSIATSVGERRASVTNTASSSDKPARL